MTDADIRDALAAEQTARPAATDVQVMQSVANVHNVDLARVRDVWVRYILGAGAS